MKKIMMILVLGALMACLIPGNAQTTQEWKTTSSMQTSGSALAPQVTAVGAMNVAQQATTTSTHPAYVKVGPRKEGNFDDAPEGSEGDDGSPIGDAVLPLMLMALAFAGYSTVRVYRRKRRV